MLDKLLDNLLGFLAVIFGISTAVVFLAILLDQ